MRVGSELEGVRWKARWSGGIRCWSRCGDEEGGGGSTRVKPAFYLIREWIGLLGGLGLGKLDQALCLCLDLELDYFYFVSIWFV